MQRGAPVAGPATGCGTEWSVLLCADADGRCYDLDRLVATQR